MLETQCKCLLQVITTCWILRISVCDDTGHYQALETQCKCLLQVITRRWRLSVSVCYRSSVFCLGRFCRARRPAPFW